MYARTRSEVSELLLIITIIFKCLFIPVREHEYNIIYKHASRWLSFGFFLSLNIYSNNVPVYHHG